MLEVRYRPQDDTTMYVDWQYISLFLTLSLLCNFGENRHSGVDPKPERKERILKEVGLRETQDLLTMLLQIVGFLSMVAYSQQTDC